MLSSADKDDDARSIRTSKTLRTEDTITLSAHGIEDVGKLYFTI